MSLLSQTIEAIRPISQRAVDEADARQAQLTKPPGSMGQLEDLGAQLSGIAGTCPPPLPQRPAIAVFGLAGTRWLAIGLLIVAIGGFCRAVSRRVGVGGKVLERRGRQDDVPGGRGSLGERRERGAGSPSRRDR